MAKQPSVAATTNRRALLASGRQVDATSKAEVARKKAQRQEWQAEAWRCYYDVPEVGAGFDLIENVLSRARLVIAVDNPEGGEPEIVDRDDTDANARLAWAALDRLQSSQGGQSAIVAGLGTNIGVVGEAYLVGWKPDPDGAEEWDAFSPSQIAEAGDKFKLKTAPNQREDQMRPLGGDDFVCRIWRRDPQWRDLAISPMRSLIDTSDNLHTLTQSIRATALSQVSGAGLLLVPSELSFGAPDPTDDSGGQGMDADPLTDDMLAVMSAPMLDPSSPAATVPLVVRGPADHLKSDVFRHVSFARDIDQQMPKEREELRKTIATRLDLPAEMILGMGDMNHWNAWVVDEQAFDQHFKPLLSLICWGLTTGYLRPSIVKKGADEALLRYRIWFDPASMVKHPNQAADAQDAIEVGAIGWESYRAAKGFSEADAPNEDDYRRWLEVQAAKRGGTADLAVPALESRRPTRGAPDETPDEKEPVPIAASARDQLPLGSRLVEIERVTLTRLQDAADAALARVLEVAGATLRRKIGNRGELAAQIDGVPNRLVATTLGKTISGKFADDAQLIEAGGFVSLHEKWDTLTRQAQRRVARLAREHGADIDPEEFVDRNEKARELGWQLLLVGLSGLAALRLYDPDPLAPSLGEHDSTHTVPISVVRGALSRAGGSNGRVLENGTMVETDHQGREIAAGGIATGPTAMDAMREAGYAPVGMLWSSGDPERPFDPHQRLDGVEFADWGDDALAADPGEFPYVSVYWPGDHDGCVCMAAPILEAVEVDLEAA